MRNARIVVLALVLLAGLAVGHARRGAFRPVSIAPSGPYAVGRAQQEWADRSRTDRLAPIGGTPRVISAWLWYPAATGGGRLADYAPGAWTALHRYGWAQTSFDRIRTGVREDVPIAAGRFPVVVLLPGLGMSAPQYQTVAAGLAARGYVVVGVTPTYSAAVTVLGGRAVRASAAGKPASLGGPRGTDLAAVWAGDARFAAGQAGVRLGRHVDATRVVYVGHAFGAAGAMAACREDPRCVGAASLDGRFVDAAADAGAAGGPVRAGRPVRAGGPVPAGGPVALARPLLLLGGRFGDADRRVYQAAHGPRFAYTITGAAFTDYAAYHLAAPLRPFLSVGERESLATATDYLGAFLDVAARGRPWADPGSSRVRAADMLGR